MSTESMQVEATVIKTLPNACFLVQANLGGEKHEVLAHLSGRMRKHYIRITLGDLVTVELSPYDLSKGRIVYRGKQ